MITKDLKDPLYLSLISDIKKKNRDIITSKNSFLNLTKLKTYSIDDKNTIEIDDAFSIQKIENKTYLWIHIASPSVLIPINNEISIRASRLSSTIYDPESISYMFPKELVIECLSLSRKRECVALSMALEISDNGNIVGYKIFNSIVRLTYNLTYEEADEILDYQPKEESDLIEIFNILNIYSIIRKSNGSLSLNEPQGFFYEENNNLYFKVKEFSPSRKLVSESMILFGSLIANYCRNNSIDIPYRNQQAPTTKLPTSQTINSHNHLHIYNYIVKSKLSKSTIDIRPTGHFSLGLKEYTHATSPLRRYIDYITHYQVISHINNEPLIPINILIEKISQYNKRSLNNSLISRNNQREMILRYLGKYLSKNREVIFLRWLIKNKNIALIFYKELYLDIVTILYGDMEFQLGDEFSINIDSIDIDKDNIHAHLIT
ncbi:MULTISPECIES: ribonuclease catalytic domain-containing protein [unclassified Prochlorococcus]|uniref:ribonuclease catalytic domain-containing protein n=1 Tax=unclassified Prochlorococcus TaxID=2627481 RepID=UPI000533B1B6|nr:MULTISPECIES: ribonuclease catalytic domain-containing protein [unclassified Prochlorococcus]KGG15290.1 Exoribonuclease II [Prochlorococcus sp. MIT 0602]KGG17568.1 Exoribonuclease II [Prochlorococcus sp. MIT 0603]